MAQTHTEWLPLAPASTQCLGRKLANFEKLHFAWGYFWTNKNSLKAIFFEL